VAYLTATVTYFSFKKLFQRMNYNAYQLSEPIFPWYEKREVEVKQHSAEEDEFWNRQLKG